MKDFLCDKLMIITVGCSAIKLGNLTSSERKYCSQLVLIVVPMDFRSMESIGFCSRWRSYKVDDKEAVVTFHLMRGFVLDRIDILARQANAEFVQL